MSLVDRAAWVLERNLEADWTLERLAEACGVSRFHLSHAFAQKAGRTVMQYLRARRLSEAAAQLAKGRAGILDLALQAGYGSHAAFSRAFREAFDATPEEVRDAGTVEGLALTPPWSAGPASVMTAPRTRLETPGEMSFVGLEDRYRLGQTAGIPGQWGRFMSQYWRIEAPQDPIPWGVADAADEDGEFTYMTAARVGPSAAAPEGLVRRRIPARTYLVFVHRGHASRIGDTVAAIWNDWLPELAPELGLELLDAPSLERHCDAFDPGTGLGGVEIWVPVQQA